MPYAQRTVSRTAAILAIAVLFSGGLLAQTGGKNFLWRVQSGTAVMFLAGSVHALTPDAYPLNPAYQRAFDASSALVEEIDLAEADSLVAAPALLARGLFQDGRTFDQVVSAETAALVASKLKNSPL